MLSRAAWLSALAFAGSVATAHARDAPVAAISGPATAKVGATVTFDGGSSTKDPAGAIEQYAWDLDGDGSFETVRTTPRVSVTLDAPGERHIGLRVTDDTGATSVAVGSIRVEAPAAGADEPAPARPVAGPGPGAGPDAAPPAIGGAPELGIAPLDAPAQAWVVVGSLKRFAAINGAARRRAGAVRAHGLWLNLLADRPARFALSVSVARADARRLGLKGAREGARVVVARAVTRLARAGQRPHRLVLPARVRRALRAPVTLLVRGAATDAQGRTAGVARAFALRR